LLRAASVAAPASVQQLFQRLRGTPLWPTALAIRAERVETAQGPAAALASIDESEGEVPDLTLPINAELFRTRTRLLIALGRVDEARKGVDAALAAHPETAAFHEIHGLVLEAELASGSGKATPESIREAHARAVELDPEGSHALESLGRRNEADGNLDAALALYERAALAALERISPRQAAAEALLRAGRADEAEAVWEEQLEEHPWDAASAQGLVQLRLGRGVTDDRTLELAERAVLFRGGPAARELLLTVHRQRGEQDRADQLAEAFEAGRPLPPSRITPIEGL
jgi:tetratricopeptide (TPR) repeat protein